MSRYDFDAQERRLGYALCIGLVLIAAMCHGCGATAIDRQTSALGSARSAHAGGVQAIRVVLEDELVDSCRGSEDPDACVDARLEEHRGLERSVDGAAGALDAWALALYGWGARVLAGEADADTPPPGLCDLSQRAIDLVLRIVAETDIPAGPLRDLQPDLGCGEGKPGWACEPKKKARPEPVGGVS